MGTKVAAWETAPKKGRTSQAVWGDQPRGDVEGLSKVPLPENMPLGDLVLGVVLGAQFPHRPPGVQSCGAGRRGRGLGHPPGRALPAPGEASSDLMSAGPAAAASHVPSPGLSFQGWRPGEPERG